MTTYPFILRSLLILSCITCLFTSCSEEPALPTTVSYFPEFTLDQYILHELGTDYTDKPVIATENGKKITFKQSGNVNTNQIGVHTIMYTATSTGGLVTKAFRYIIVTDAMSVIKATDISGDYEREDRAARKMKLTKVADGFYESFNVLGNTSDATAIVAQISSTKLVIPLQDILATGGSLAGSMITDVIADEFNDPDTFGLIIDDATVQWHVKADDNNTARYPTGRRLRRWVFVKE